MSLGFNKLTIFAEDADNLGVLINMLNGVLNLEQTAIRVECSSALIVTRLLKSKGLVHHAIK